MVSTSTALLISLDPFPNKWGIKPNRRRGMRLRVAQGRGLPARRHVLADRGHHPRSRAVVTPAPGEHGKLPFWKAPGPGRPAELGRAIGRFTRELRSKRRDAALDTLAARPRPRRVGGDATSSTTLTKRARSPAGSSPTTGPWWSSGSATSSATGGSASCRRSARGSSRRGRSPSRPALQERLGPGAQVLWSDDGIVIRLPEAVDRIPVEDLVFEPEDIEEAVVATLPGTALFASVFREAAARALLLPRRRPGQRTPLWQQRQRSADLLTAAAQHADFPILLEATRECLRDHFDVPGAEGADAGDPVALANASWPSTPSAPRPSRSRSCSGGSRSTCTRATRRSPSAARRRSRSTTTSCGSSWAPRTSATSSTPARSTRSSSSCSGSPTGGRLAAPTACTTSCGTWGR